MDWINCNSCCRQPGDDKERGFALTSCGHIFCDVCLGKADCKEKCIVCGSNCQITELSAKMKPDAEMFFLEPGELNKRNFNQLNKLLEFQKQHRVRLVSYHRQILQKYKELHKQYTSANDCIKDLRNSLASATDCINDLKNKCMSASNRIQELETENHKLRTIIQTQGNSGALLSPNSVQSSPQGSYQRSNMTRSSPTHVPIPQEKNRISPGRLTLVKTAQGSRTKLSPSDVCTSISSPPVQPSVATTSFIGTGTPNPSATTAMQIKASASRRQSPQGTYYSPTQLQPHLGELSQHQLSPREEISRTPTLPGAGLFRSMSQNSSPSPTRSVANSVSRMSLTPGQQFHGAKSYHYPSFSSSPLHGSYPDRHLPLQQFGSSPHPVSADHHQSKMQLQGFHPSFSKFGR